MQLELISHNEDLNLLIEKGYDIEVDGGYLLVHHIPYLNSELNICYGTLVSTLNIRSDNVLLKPDNHVIYFKGGRPYNVDGEPVTGIEHEVRDIVLGNITVNRSFSNRPNDGYSNYYEKVKRYSDIISDPVKSLDANITEKTFKTANDIIERKYKTVFNYIDTNSIRAKIDSVNLKLSDQKIAIVGVGGTGSYILDLVSKSPVSEIHIFDGDDFQLHNAFRAPGAASVEVLSRELGKVEYLSSIYSNMHKYIISHKVFLDETNLELLDEMTFVFLCIDKNGPRKLLVEHLVNKEIPFIDVGIGVNEVDGKISGLIRTTTVTKHEANHVSDLIPLTDNEVVNDYSTNIQVAELNALNACLAVVKWKQLCGFYVDAANHFNSVFMLDTSSIVHSNDEA